MHPGGSGHEFSCLHDDIPRTGALTNDSRLVRTLLACNVTLLLALIGSLAWHWHRPLPRTLTLERLDIVDSTGALALVLSNGARLPGARFSGREYPPSWVGRGRSAGLLFDNQQGDEVGGLIYEGTPTDAGHVASGHFSFDQWQQTQVVAMQYLDNGTSRRAGVRVWDRPADAPLERQFALAKQMSEMDSGPARDAVNAERRRVRDEVAGTERLFLGSRDRQAGLELRDPQGRVRALLAVDSLGNPSLAFLDRAGHVTA